MQILAQNLKHSSKSRIGWRREPNLDDSYANWARMALSPRRGANSIRFGGKKGGRERGREGVRGEGEGKDGIKYLIFSRKSELVSAISVSVFERVEAIGGSPEITDTSSDLLSNVKTLFLFFS